jgi:cyclopropane fatty-acyl-phospholipid synthase-like methyltransferase
VNLYEFEDVFMRAVGRLDDLKQDDYYNQRHQRLETFASGEIVTIRHVAKHIDYDITICEVGCGLGQMSLALAAMGFKVEAVDGDRARFARLERVTELVSERFPVIKKTLKLTHGSYPRDYAPPAGAVLIFGNVVNTGWDRFVKEHGAAGALRGHRALLDFRVWGTVRERDERILLEKDLTSVGYSVRLVAHTVFDVIPPC